MAKDLPISFQKIALDTLYPDSKCTIDKRKNRLDWQGKIRPTYISRRYNIRIVCDFRKPIKVLLYGHNIKGLERDDFPHHYEKNIEKKEVSLCLYYRNEFNYTKLIAVTIIPWIKEWLLHYELWLATGVWNGGGHVA